MDKDSRYRFISQSEYRTSQSCCCETEHGTCHGQLVAAKFRDSDGSVVFPHEKAFQGDFCQKPWTGKFCTRCYSVRLSSLLINSSLLGQDESHTPLTRKGDVLVVLQKTMHDSTVGEDKKGRHSWRHLSTVYWGLILILGVLGTVAWYPTLSPYLKMAHSIR